MAGQTTWTSATRLMRKFVSIVALSVFAMFRILLTCFAKVLSSLWEQLISKQIPDCSNQKRVSVHERCAAELNSGYLGGCSPGACCLPAGSRCGICRTGEAQVRSRAGGASAAELSNKVLGGRLICLAKSVLNDKTTTGHDPEVTMPEVDDHSSSQEAASSMQSCLRLHAVIRVCIHVCMYE